MAYTTDNSAVNNSIALAQKFLPILDEVYKASAKTSILDVAENRVRFVGAKTVQLFKTSMDGLGNYSRNSGYLTGDVTGSWESKELTKDRGRAFMVDAMDNDETIGMAFGTLAGEFIRTKVVPELDAYRFATLASASGIISAADDLTSSDNVADLISVAEAEMSDAEVPVEGRILFISEKAFALLKNDITRIVENDELGVQHDIAYYDGMRVISVPSARFNTAITLKDGSTAGQTEGGYTIGGYPINFMIVHPSAVMQVTKHVLPRIFSPAVNQEADAWKFDYRVYHDIFVLANKTKGIYLHRAETANP